VALAGCVALTAVVVGLRARWDMVDLGVYRRGAGDVYHSASLYSDSAQLPFTYPPFAASVFLLLLGLGAVGAIITDLAISALAYLFVMVLACRRLGLGDRAMPFVLVLGFCLEPVWRTLALGQVNLLLMALVVADTLLISPQRRGWLVGVAAGIKLVPGIFVIYFALQRDWPGIRRAALGFAGTIVVGLLLARNASETYWTKLFFSTDHFRGVAYVINQSLNAILVRLVHQEHPPAWAYLLLALGAVALATGAAARQLRGGDEVAALTCIAIGGLLASPISWTHHWIWLAPAIVVLVARRKWVSAAVVSTVTIVAPMWFTPSMRLREFHHNWWQALLCMSYAAIGIWFLLQMLATDPARVQPIPPQLGGPEQARRVGTA